MRRTVTRSPASAPLAAGAFLVLVLAGCQGHATATKALTPSASPHAATSASAHASPFPAGQVASSASPGIKTCPAGDTAARIGGVSKCLAVGQQCSAKNASQYPAYGFTCEQKATRYVLRKT